jgi:serine/threonine-protein kinase RsbW
MRDGYRSVMGESRTTAGVDVDETTADTERRSQRRVTDPVRRVRPPGPADPETIKLRLPADARHAATARVVAASLAADLGFDVDEIDDLRLGVNEAVAVLLDDGGAVSRRSRLEVEFRVSDRRIDIEVSVRPGATAGITLDELAERILTAVVDHHDHVDGTVRLSKSTRDAA